MSNMSYCRFENTSNDLLDCLWDLEERIDNNGLSESGEKLSDYELRGLESIMDTIEQIQKMADDIYELILKQ